MVEDKGFEPNGATSQESHNTQTNIAQNLSKSDTSKNKDTPTEDKTITSPEQEKHTFLHSKCVTGVHQNPPVQTMSKDLDQPDLEVLMEAWNGLTEAMKQYYMLVVKSRKEKK